MFTRVKPSIIFSIWLGWLCWCIQIAKCSSSDCETPTAVIRAKAGCPWPSPSFSHRPPCQCLRSHLNSRLTRRVMSPFLLYSHVRMSVSTNQRPEYRSRDRPRPIRSQTQDLICNYSPNECLIQFVLTPALRGTSGPGHSTSVQCSACHQLTPGWFMASMIRLMRQLELWFSHGFPRQNLNPLELVFIFCDHNNILGNKCFLNVITDNEASRAHFYLQFP